MSTSTSTAPRPQAGAPDRPGRTRHASRVRLGFGRVLRGEKLIERNIV